VGRTVREVLPNVEAYWIERYEQVVATGEPAHFEDYIAELDGYFEVTAYWTAPGQFAVVFVNVTEKRRAIQKLQESEERYRALFESAGDAAFLLGDTILTCNEQACRLFATTHQGLIDKHPADLSPTHQPDGRLSREVAAEQIAAALAGQPQMFAWVHQRSDGTPFHTEVSLCRVQNVREPLLIAVVRDVSDRVRAEREREELEAQLRHAQKMEAVGQLAGGVAHDFNNVLQAIVGYTDLCTHALPEDAPARSYLEQVRKAADRAADLTRQLLAFSRRDPLNPAVLDLNAVVGDMLEMLRRLLGEQVEVVFRPSRSLPPVLADASQVQQALMNLCINARDAMPDGGTAVIETAEVSYDSRFVRANPWARKGRFVKLQVTDTGVGFSDEVRERMFEPFFTTKEPGVGTGLGLATVYAIVERHGGFLRATSVPAAGASFCLHFPVTEEAAPIRDPQDSQTPPAPRGRETILVAEDDDLVRSLAVAVLERAGYTVVSATDGDDALRIFDEHGGSLDLALIDIVMPRLGGRDAARELRKRAPDLPILFLSGYAHQPGQPDWGDLPPTELLRKPYSPAELLSRVRSALDGRR